ncbi:MAG: DUF1836 domain-containing protein [Lachnospiraceae bacterium]|nr:DUF1836 domain-containing protein [Lachnospiraceae bacterium]
MMKSNKELLREYIEHISKMQVVHASELPSIQLYMDQVTTFMNERLEAHKRYDDDKIMTKTMINNYAKNDLLPSPEKKKYSKDHMILLLFIYYFKNILSITDIQSLLTPITDEYFQAKEGMDLTELYESITTLRSSANREMLEDLVRQMDRSSSLFPDEENREELQRFAFICMISYDVYMKKMLLERMIDEIRAEETDTGKKKK